MIRSVMLQKAFGFQRSLVISDKEAKRGHAEMRFGDGIVSGGAAQAQFVASRVSVRGKNTQTIHVHLKDGLARGRERPARSFSRSQAISSTGIEPIVIREGHVQTFDQTLRQLSREEAEKASGLKIDAPSRHRQIDPSLRRRLIRVARSSTGFSAPAAG